jgi:hypothetical protein
MTEDAVKLMNLPIYCAFSLQTGIKHIQKVKANLLGYQFMICMQTGLRRVLEVMANLLGDHFMFIQT